MKNIVIVGAGFGGLQTALGLEKKFKNNKDITLTLIDKRDYHLFTPNLYEAATAEEELVSIEQIKKSITLPFSDILAGKKIKFIKAEVKSINPEDKQIILAGKTIAYDYLVLALGSESDYFNIPGAKENSLTLKDLPDALRLRNAIDFAISSQRQDINKKNIRILLAGGGYTGLELAAELKGLVDFLAWKNSYPREKIEIAVIDGNSKLVQGFDDRLSEDAYERLQELGIRVHLSSRVSGVDANFIELLSGEKMAYDVLIWTAGVKGCAFHTTAEMALDRRGRLPVNKFFQVENHHNIFALGDLACVIGTNGKPVPGSAQDAIDQAEYLAYALPFLMQNKQPIKSYKNKEHGFIVSLGGKWAVISYGRFYFTGLIAYLADQFAHFSYYASIVGWWKALRCVVFQVEMYSRND